MLLDDDASPSDVEEINSSSERDEEEELMGTLKKREQTQKSQANRNYGEQEEGKNKAMQKTKNN